MSLAREGLNFAVIAYWLLRVPSLAIGAETPSASSLTENSPSAWVHLGKRLKVSYSTFTDIDASRHALSPSLADGADMPYLTWIEIDAHGVPQVHVQYWKENAWIPLGGMLNVDPSHQAYDPVIVTADSIPYVAWIELNKQGIPQLYLKRWAQGAWISVGQSLNHDPTRAAANPSMAVGLGRPYLAWTESTEKRVYQVHVKSLTENGWMKLGGSLNEDPLKDAIEPSIGIAGSTPYVTWCEKAANGYFQVYVKHWTGEGWIRDGGSLNNDISAHALSPSIASNGIVPYVTWAEFNEKGISHVYVKHLVNSAWIRDGGSLNLDPSHHALSPSLAFIDKTPYVAWVESDSRGITQIHVKRWADSGWILEGQSLNLNASKPGSGPILSIVRGDPYVAWKEADGTGIFSVVVKTRH